jgi:hypothetical protein
MAIKYKIEKRGDGWFYVHRWLGNPIGDWCFSRSFKTEGAARKYVEKEIKSETVVEEWIVEG